MTYWYSIIMHKRCYFFSMFHCLILKPIEVITFCKRLTTKLYLTNNNNISVIFSLKQKFYIIKLKQINFMSRPHKLTWRFIKGFFWLYLQYNLKLSTSRIVKKLVRYCVTWTFIRWLCSTLMSRKSVKMSFIITKCYFDGGRFSYINESFLFNEWPPFLMLHP